MVRKQLPGLRPGTACGVVPEPGQQFSIVTMPFPKLLHTAFVQDDQRHALSKPNGLWAALLMLLAYVI
jgi:hypothetical protein